MTIPNMSQLEAASRRQLLRQIHTDAERAEAAAAREQARETLRRQMLGVDRKWFWDFAIGVRDDLIAQRSEALLSRDHFAHASIDRRLEQLETDLVKKIERLQLIWEQRR
jgi:hypothetical protein